ncbi:hypothetical protein VTK26DRAFT_8831 [Humicola hyalothermophila]
MAATIKKQINLRRAAEDPSTYTISWHKDWTLGATLHGGCITAALHHAAVTHLTTDPQLAPRNQPDILKLHVEFLAPCEARDSTIKITVLRTGSAASTLQLDLYQSTTRKCLALATSTNFDQALGPSVPTSCL